MPDNAEETMFECDMCEDRDTERGKVLCHLAVAHSEESTPCSCNVCNYNTINLRSYLGTLHSGNSIFNGPRSDYEFEEWRNLIASQPKQMLFHCSECDYITSERRYVKKHIRTKHSKEKPFVCPDCNFRAEHFTVLNEHFVIKHTKDKTFLDFSFVEF